jgi:ribosomal protein S27AE
MTAQQQPRLDGLRVVSEVRRDSSRDRSGRACPQCGAAMHELVTIEAMLGSPGLKAYECPRCGRVTSELRSPKRD